MRTMIRTATVILSVLLFSCKDEVTVVVPVAEVQVTGPGELLAGTTAHFTAVPRDDQGNALTNRTITWSSSNGSVATVSTNGTVTGVLGGQATVSAKAEGRTGSTSLQVNNPAPVLSSTDPEMTLASGDGFELTVNGSGFVSSSVVQWNGENRTTTFQSSSVLKAVISAADLAGAGVFEIAVYTPSPGGGTSSPRSFPVNNPQPMVSGTDPSVITAGSEAFTLTVLGSGFVPNSVVRWNGHDRETTFVSSGELEAEIAADDVVSSGTAQITVFNPQPGGGASGNRPLTVGNPVPTIASLTPDHQTMVDEPIVGAMVTVTGTGFLSTSVVEWEGESLPTTFVSTTELRALLSWGNLATPGWKAVTVTNPSPGGGTSGAADFAVRIPVTGPFTAAGTNHTCALSTSGQAYCWGLNTSGQLGDGSNQDSNRPQEVVLPPDPAGPEKVDPSGPQSTAVASGLTFVALDVGWSHACALDEVGHAYCWGANGSGQLGDGSTYSRSEPVAVSGNLNFVALRLGAYHSCGLTSDGQAYCWGDNYYDQLGDASGSDRSTPTMVQQGSLTFKALGAGFQHTCALSTEGAMYCWGDNSYGELGDGTTQVRPLPTQVSSPVEMAGMALGNGYTCSWSSEGKAYCWGFGGTGQLGNGSYENQNPYPLAVSGSYAFETIRAGDSHVCGVTTASEVLCWGAGAEGQLGQGVRAGSSTPVGVVDLPPMVEVTAGDTHSCGRAVSGQLFCWGEEGYGQLGNGNVSYRLSPVRVSGGPSAFRVVSTGYGHSCGLSETGKAYCWGRGSQGQLGDGTWTDAATAVAVAGNLEFKAITTGQVHTCALTIDGTAYCWGNGGWGALGTGILDSEGSPVLVAGGHTFQTIRAGGHHTCGVRTDGQVLCWGAGSNGQLGNGSQGSVLVPTPISAPPGRVFVHAKTGVNHTCAVTDTKEAWCWGWNSYGQVGDGTTENRFSPVQVAGLPADVEWISAGAYHSCALDSSGKATCWGQNWNGELGIGNYSGNWLTPQSVVGDQSFRLITAGSGITCAVSLSDEGYCWGYGLRGVLGSGNQSSHNQPTPIIGGHSWRMIGEAQGYTHICGVTNSGEAYCWGWQSAGALGIGEWGSRAVPVQVDTSVEFGVPVLPVHGQDTGHR